MNVEEARSGLLRVFAHWRGVHGLGANELLVALDALEGGWGAGDDQELRRMAVMLWCHSPEDQAWLLDNWDRLLAQEQEQSLRPVAERPVAPQPEREPPNSPRHLHAVAGSDRPAPDPSLRFMPLPVRAPYTPWFGPDRGELTTYWPVSRRDMIYRWRYLRRPAPDGPADELDITATVERLTREGVFRGPVFRRREKNHARLLLLLDQGGSMMPLQRFTRDIVDTAREDSTIEQVDVFYFHNVITGNVYRDPYLTEPADWDQTLKWVDAETSVLIVSDAGAARGHRSLDRIDATSTFLKELQQRTTLLAWLNPMPAERWAGSSAQVIAYLVRMFPMDHDGFGNAVDWARSGPARV